MSFMAAFQKGSREAVADLGRQATEALLNLPQVTVAAIEGPCVGGGVVLAAACDLRWAAPGSWLSVPEMDVGLPLTWGALPRLVQLVGETRAVDLVLSRRRVERDEALRMGLVTAALPTPFDDHLTARLADLASLPQNALRTTKRQLRQIREGDFDPRTDAKALLDALSDPETATRAQAYMQAHRMERAAADEKTPES
jgi:enoyl-CoA hydratase/carnithine racemase